MTKFKIGDRVRVTGDTQNLQHMLGGEIGTVEEILGEDQKIEYGYGGYPGQVYSVTDNEDVWILWDVAEEDLEAVE